MKCLLCVDCGWVCENHPDRPWEGEHACTCGGAGAACARCNAPKEGTAPRPPEGFGRTPTRRAGAISNQGWAREFDEPVSLPGGRTLRTLHDLHYWASKKGIRAARMAGRDRGAYARHRPRRTRHVCEDRRHARAEPPRRASVRSVSQGSSLGKAKAEQIKKYSTLE
jgi:hypothetical protein